MDKKTKDILQELDKQIEYSDKIVKTTKTEGWKDIIEGLGNIRIGVISDMSMAGNDQERIIAQAQFNILDKIIAYFKAIADENKIKLENYINNKQSIKEDIERHEEEIKEVEKQTRQSGHNSAI